MTSPEPIPPRYGEGDPPKPQAKEGGGAGGAQSFLPVAEGDGEGDHAKHGGGAGRASGNESPLWKRLAWFVLLWAAGVAAVGSVAFILGWLLSPGVA